ncbi:MAG: sodium:solute symporter family protein [Clostridiales bacterium]|jgi:SSS family solute:Na+ symporter|nr:sodium:solute symporter family protein [Clostridiales bacterium]
MNQAMLITVMAVYLVITIGIALVIGMRKTTSTADYSVGGRGFGGVILFFTMLATIVGASSVMGYTYYYYDRGIDQAWFTLGTSISYLLFVFYLGPKIHKFGVEENASTIGDWFEKRFGKTSKYISSILIVVAYIAITAFQYIAMATIMNLILGWNYNLCLIITAVIVIFYTSLGGLWAVASTDVIQGAMTLLGVIVMTPILVSKAGGLSAVLSTVPATHLQVFGVVSPVAAISSTLVFALGIVSWPDIWQRCYAAKNTPVLKKSFVTFIVANLVLTAMVAFLGFAAHSFYPAFEGSRNAMLPMMILENIPNFFGAIFLASLLAVIMGTADSTLLVSAVMVEKDLLAPFISKNQTENQRLKTGKIVTAVVGIAVLGIMFYSTEMFDLWVMSADITGATLAFPILFGFMGRRFGGTYACLGSIILGFAGWLASQTGLVSLEPILFGGGLSLVAYVVLAYLEKNGVIGKEKLTAV